MSGMAEIAMGADHHNSDGHKARMASAIQRPLSSSAGADVRGSPAPNAAAQQPNGGGGGGGWGGGAPGAPPGLAACNWGSNGPNGANHTQPSSMLSQGGDADGSAAAASGALPDTLAGLSLMSVGGGQPYGGVGSLPQANNKNGGVPMPRDQKTGGFGGPQYPSFELASIWGPCD